MNASPLRPGSHREPPRRPGRSVGYGGERKSPGTPNECMERWEICIEDIFRGRKSRGLTYRRAVNTFSHQKRKNSQIWTLPRKVDHGGTIDAPPSLQPGPGRAWVTTRPSPTRWSRHGSARRSRRLQSRAREIATERGTRSTARTFSVPRVKADSAPANDDTSVKMLE